MANITRRQLRQAQRYDANRPQVEYTQFIKAPHAGTTADLQRHIGPTRVEGTSRPNGHIVALLQGRDQSDCWHVSYQQDGYRGVHYTHRPLSETEARKLANQVHNELRHGDR